MRALLLLLFLALLLPACGGAEADGPTTLRFWAFGREGEVVQELMRDFERENPDVRVRVQQIPWTAAHEKLLTAFVGDATPDLAQLGNTWIAEFTTLDALQPLDAYVARSRVVDPERFFPGIWATNVVDGQVYGIPWYVDTRVIYYRTDLLRQAGYDSVPKTWEEWREAMRAVKRELGPERYAIFLPVNEWAQPVIFGMQAGSPLLKDDAQYGAFGEPAFARGFDFYLSLFREGLAPEMSNTQVANLYQEFAAGTFAMYISGPWNVGEFSSRLPAELQDDWSTAPLPGPDGPGVSMAGGASLVVFRASAHKQAAWRVVEYLARPESQRRFNELSGNLPANRIAWQDSALLGDRRLRAFWQQLQRVVPLPKVPESEAIAIRVQEIAETAILGRATPAQALRRLDADVNAMLEKRRWMLARETERADAGAPGAASTRGQP